MAHSPSTSPSSYSDEEEVESLSSASLSTTTSIMSSSSPNFLPHSPRFNSNSELATLFVEDPEEEDVNHSTSIPPTPQPQSTPTSSPKLESNLGEEDDEEEEVNSSPITSSPALQTRFTPPISSEIASLFGDGDEVDSSPPPTLTPPLQSTPASISELASLFDNDNEVDSGIPVSSSLIPTPAPNPASIPTPTRTSSSTKQQKLSALLSQSPQPITPRKKPNEDLTTLRKQLEILVSVIVVTPRIRDAKGKIVRQIQFLEEQEKERVESEKREKLQKEGLPEPIAKSEKAKLMRASRRVAKGKAFKEGSQKRKKFDDEDELDGEDRLKLGLDIGKKKKKGSASGKWYSQIYGRR